MSTVPDPPVYTTGSWEPLLEQEDAFVAAWREFASWASGLDGAVGDAILARDVRDEGRYVSFLAWQDMESIRAWKSHPEFKQRMGRVQELVDRFAPTEVEVVARIRGSA